MSYSPKRWKNSLVQKNMESNRYLEGVTNLATK